MKKILMSVAFLLTLGVCLIACSKKTTTETSSNETAIVASVEKEQEINYKTIKEGDTFTIGFSQMENNSPFRVTETESFKALETQYDDVKVIITDAQSSVAKQVSDCEDLLARGIDILALAPIQKDGYEPVYEAAKEAGVPIIMVDRNTNGEAGVDYVTYIVPDNYMEGRQVGLYLAAVTKGNARILELEGQAGSSGAIDRGAGFNSVIDMFPEMEIIAKQPADFNRMKGLSVMENYIQKYSTDEYDAIYAQCDEMALGAIEAMKAANINTGSGKHIVIVSHDGEKQALEAIMNGELDFTLECPPGYGPDTYAISKQILMGESVPSLIRPTTQRIYTPYNTKALYDPNSAF
jgi:ribose transport system substrate-binding protein